MVRGRPLQNRYVAQSTGGLRIVLSQALTGAVLKVGSIYTLLGGIRDIKFVQRV